MLSLSGFSLRAQNAGQLDFQLAGTDFYGYTQVDVIWSGFDLPAMPGVSYYFNVTVDLNQNLQQGQCVRETETENSLHPAIAGATSMQISNGSVQLYINNLENLNLESPMTLFTIHFAGSPGTTVSLDWRTGAGVNQLVSIPGVIYVADLSEPVVADFPVYHISGTIIKPPFTQSNCDGGIDGAVPGVEVSLSTGFWCAPAQTGQIQMNASDGSYAFEVNRYFDYGIFLYKFDNPGCGVNSLDYYLGYRHLLGIDFLDYPWQFVAADMNLDHVLTPGDAARIKQLVNGTFVAPEGWHSWTFIPVKDYAFFPPVAPDYTYPSYTEAIFINDLNADYANQDFAGIKRADVDGSCSACTAENLTGTSGNAATAFLELPDGAMEPGEQVRLPLYVDSRYPLGACAFALGFDPEYVDVLAVEPASGVYWEEDMLNEAALAEGTVRVAWMSPRAEGFSPESGQPLCYVILQSRRKVVSLRPLVQLLPFLQDCSAVSPDLQVSKLALRFEEALEPVVVFPNPASGHISVLFEQDQAAPVRLEIFDASGTRMWESDGFRGAGTLQWEIPLNTWPAGVYVVRVRSGDRITSTRFVISR